MALSEMDRVALYWPESTIQSLRIVTKKCREATSHKRRADLTEVLDGGCLLYRICRFDRLNEDPRD
jgi:hypothetical protein